MQELDKPLSPQAIAAQDRSAPLKVTGKLKVALEAMIWNGERREQAAQTAGMTDHSLRSALRKPHVKRFYRDELQVLRESHWARNIHRLAEIRDAENNMPAVNAIKEMGIGEPDSVRNAANVLPGLQIVVIQGDSSPATPIIDVSSHALPKKG